MTKPRTPNLHEEEPQADREGATYAELVRLVQAGDQHAMETLLMRAQEVAYRFSLLVCGRPGRRGRRDAGGAAEDVSVRGAHP